MTKGKRSERTLRHRERPVRPGPRVAPLPALAEPGFPGDRFRPPPDRPIAHPGYLFVVLRETIDEALRNLAPGRFSSTSHDLFAVRDELAEDRAGLTRVDILGAQRIEWLDKPRRASSIGLISSHDICPAPARARRFAGPFVAKPATSPAAIDEK